VVREFVQRRFGRTLSRSSCLNYLHRLDFVLKRPKKHLIKADPERRATFVREYALLRAAAQATDAKCRIPEITGPVASVDFGFALARLDRYRNLRDPALRNGMRTPKRAGRRTIKRLMVP